VIYEISKGDLKPSKYKAKLRNYISNIKQEILERHNIDFDNRE